MGLASLGERARVAAPLFIAIVAVGVHLGSVKNGFLADDRCLIAENTALDSKTPWTELFTRPWGDTASDEFSRAINRGYYRPLSLAFFRVERALFGTAAWAFHLVGLLLHGLAAALVYLLARRWLTIRQAGLAALIFAAHAIHAEAVNAVAYQPTLLSGCLVLACLWRSRIPAARPSRVAAGVALSVAYAAAVLVKETAVVLPGLMLALDLAFDRESLRGRIVPVYLPMALVAAAYLILRGAVLEDGLSYFEGVPAWGVALTMAGVFAMYLRLLLVPHPLCPFYEWSIVPPVDDPLDPFALTGLAAVILYLALAALCTLRARRSQAGSTTRVVCFALWLLPISLIPVMHIAPFLIVAGERFLYVGSLALCLPLAIAAERLFSHERGAIRVTAVVLFAAYLALLGALSLNRARDWRSDESLARATVRSHPRALNARLTLGRLLLEQGEYEEALEHARAARRIAPSLSATRRLEEAAAARLDAGSGRSSLDP